MSLQRILKPYRIWLPETLHERYGTERSFANKNQVKAFIKEAQEIDPTFNPPVHTALFRFYDSTTGKPYPSKWDYEKEQMERRERVAKAREQNITV